MQVTELFFLLEIKYFLRKKKLILQAKGFY